MDNPQDRPKITSVEHNIGTKELEAFQNQTLRPIIKQLHAILIAHFSQLLFKKKGGYFLLAEDQRNPYIRAIFQKEIQYKAELKGMIIGHFTHVEYNEYRQNARLFDKRIYSMVEERILTSQNELRDLRG
jgi:hypothetical protein